MTREIEWPREIWMAELDEHHNGTGTVVLSEFATVARWEGDKERNCEFQRYVDGDIYDSHAKYMSVRLAQKEAEHDTVWDDALEAALGEIPEHWCSGSQARDRIRALRKDIQNG